MPKYENHKHQPLIDEQMELIRKYEIDGINVHRQIGISQDALKSIEKKIENCKKTISILEADK